MWRALHTTEIYRARELLGGPNLDTHATPSLGESSSAGEFSRSFDQKLRYAGVTRRQFERMAIKLALPFIAAGAVLILIKPLSLSLLLVIYPICLCLYLRNKCFRRAELFERDYVAFMLSLASAIRAGQDPVVALIEAQNLFPATSVLGGTLQEFKLEIERGRSEQEALLGFAKDIAHPDIKLFRTAFLLARKEGSSLGNCLQRLARVTRQRQSFRRKIRSALAMQKLSALGIALCAIVIGVVQWSSNPKVMLETLAHPIGMKVMLGGLSLVAMGLVWMLSLTKSRI